MKDKKAISLIVLVITIIVMIILASAVILSLDNAGIIDKSEEAVEKSNLKQVQYLATLKWSDAFLDGKTTQEELEDAVIEGLEEEGINLSEYQITVTEKGVNVAIVAKVPSEWQENVVAIVDGVPIPKGFVASGATGENTKNGGLVIYEGTEAVTDANVETAKRTRNQYVWVPVAKEDFTTKFVRQNFGLNDTISNTLGTDETFWEVVLDTATNMPLSTQDATYVTSTTLAEVQAMYASVKEYEGFYIARYEAGIDTQRTEQGNAADLPGIKEGTKVYSVMGKIPYTYIPWTWNYGVGEDTNGAVEVARKLYPNTNTNYGVVSTLTYGVQWDATLQWWLDTGAVTSVTNSTDYGNYSDHVINSAEELAAGVIVSVLDESTWTLSPYVEKDSNTLTYPKTGSWLLSTGALPATKINNVYDMAGNSAEWTMEGSSTDRRVSRGGAFNTDYRRISRFGT